MEADKANAQLPNQPQAKLPPLPKGSRIQKRPLPRRAPTPAAASGSGHSLGSVDPDGYRTPAGRAPVCVYVSSKAPFMSVIKRVRKALDNGPQKTKGLPFVARVAALSTGSKGAAASSGGGGGGGGDSEKEDGVGAADKGAASEVVVVGTGRAIEKTLNVAAWFDRQKDCRVSLRTRSIGAVDDVVRGEAESGEDDEDDEARVRMVSCLEVVVKLR